MSDLEWKDDEEDLSEIAQQQTKYPIRVAQLSIGTRGRTYYPTYTIWWNDMYRESEFVVETPFKYEVKQEREFVLYEEGRANMEAMVELINDNLTSCLLHTNPRIRTIARELLELKRGNHHMGKDDDV